jgi:hypothetical protein
MIHATGVRHCCARQYLCFIPTAEFRHSVELISGYESAAASLAIAVDQQTTYKPISLASGTRGACKQRSKR